MKRFKYQGEHIAFIKAHALQLDINELTAAFNAHFQLNKSKSSIKNLRYNLKIKTGRKRGAKKGVSPLFSAEQIAWLRTHYPQQERNELTANFQKTFNSNITGKQICCYLKNHRIKSGRSGHFQKGKKSWNAGTKGLMKANSGSFKKGGGHIRSRPIGSERTNVDGYIEIKTGEPNIWEAKHRVLWQQHHPETPLKSTDLIRFIDGDKSNVVIGNLSLFNRSEHILATAYGYSDAAPEHKQSIKLIAQISSKSKQLQEQP